MSKDSVARAEAKGLRSEMRHRARSLRREAKLRDEAVYRHFEPRIANAELRLKEDLQRTRDQIEATRAEIVGSVEALTLQVAALQRGEASAAAAGVTKEKEASRIDTWKLAVLGLVVTVVLALCVFAANLATSG